jgi:copper chaperone CopZ
MKIDVLYFEGCPNHPPAVEFVKKTVMELGIDAEVREVEVKDEEDAKRLRFFGSPTIQVDGVDIEPSARESSDYSFSCRMYDGAGLPPKEMLIAALSGGGESSGGDAHDCCKTPPPATDSRKESASKRRGLFAAGGAVIAAVVASAAGVSAAIAPVRPYFLIAAVGLLGAGFYFAYLRKEKCEPGSACEVTNPKVKRITRTALWVATVLVVAFALFPSYAGLFVGNDTARAVGGGQAEVAQLKLHIEGMTCQACALHAQKELRTVAGVRSAAVSYDKGEGLVWLDPASPASTDALIEAIEKSGYKATLNLKKK